MKGHWLLVVLVFLVAAIELTSGSFRLFSFLKHSNCQDDAIPTCGIQEQKYIFIIAAGSATLVTLFIHFFRLGAMLINAWFACLPILSVAIYFFGVIGNSNYQYKNSAERATYFPEVLADITLTSLNALLSLALYEWKRLGEVYIPLD